MVFPTEALAVVVASDWESMHERVDLKRMPMVRQNMLHCRYFHALTQIPLVSVLSIPCRA
jgi:hypothetical protein